MCLQRKGGTLYPRINEQFDFTIHRVIYISIHADLMNAK